jgi:hypothetical protein
MSFMGPSRSVHTGANIGSQVTWRTSEGAILHLPLGASRLTCLSNQLRNHAIRHAHHWYQFAHDLHRDVPNGSLYLITGTDKTNSWMVGTFSGALSEDCVSLQFRETTPVEQAAQGHTFYHYCWNNTSAPVYRMGPMNNRTHHINQNHLEAITRDDAIFEGDAPDNRNQCVFIRGYRIELNCSFTTSEEIHTGAKIHSITDAFPTDIPAPKRGISFSETLSALYGWWTRGAGSGSGQHKVPTSEGSVHKETADRLGDGQAMPEHIPPHLEVSFSTILSCVAPTSVLKAIPSISNH